MWEVSKAKHSYLKVQGATKSKNVVLTKKYWVI